MIEVSACFPEVETKIVVYRNRDAAAVLKLEGEIKNSSPLPPFCVLASKWSFWEAGR
jgi:hypothetical protein